MSFFDVSIFFLGMSDGCGDFGPGKLYARVVRHFAESMLGPDSAANIAAVTTATSEGGARSAAGSEMESLVAKVVQTWVCRLKELNTIDLAELAGVGVGCAGGRYGDGGVSVSHESATVGTVDVSSASISGLRRRRRLMCPSAIQQSLLVDRRGQNGKSLDVLPGMKMMAVAAEVHHGAHVQQKHGQEVFAYPSRPLMQHKNLLQAHHQSFVPVSRIRDRSPSSFTRYFHAGDNDHENAEYSKVSDSEWETTFEVQTSRSQKCSQLDLNFGGLSARMERNAKRRRMAQNSKGSGNSAAGAAGGNVSGAGTSTSHGITNLRGNGRTETNSETAPPADFQISFGALAASVQRCSEKLDLLEDESISVDELYPNNLTLCNDRSVASGSYHRIVGKLIKSTRHSAQLSMARASALETSSSSSSSSSNAATTSTMAITDEAAVMMSEEQEAHEMHVLVLSNVIASMGSCAAKCSQRLGEAVIPRERFFRRLVCELRW